MILEKQTILSQDYFAAGMSAFSFFFHTLIPQIYDKMLSWLADVYFVFFFKRC